MSLATLSDVIQPALHGGYAVPGLVCLGWEDASAYALAADAERAPVILQVGPSCREHTPLPVLAAMLRSLAMSSQVPVVVHLDHGYVVEDCREALDCGFTSVMYDGSRKPLEENIEQTSAVVEMAHAAGASCEGEIGFVGYAGGEESAGTDPEEARRFACDTGVDAMAISVGNVHLQQDSGIELDEERVRAIESTTQVPLVIHGGSGVPHEQRARLAAETRICKYNIGTELRMAFGSALRWAVEENPETFDRIAILKQTHQPVYEAARAAIRSVGASGRA